MVDRVAIESCSVRNACQYGWRDGLPASGRDAQGVLHWPGGIEAAAAGEGDVRCASRPSGP